MVERLLRLKDNVQEMFASRKYKEWVKKKSYNEISDPIVNVSCQSRFGLNVTFTKC